MSACYSACVVLRCCLCRELTWSWYTVVCADAIRAGVAQSIIHYTSASSTKQERCVQLQKYPRDKQLERIISKTAAVPFPLSAEHGVSRWTDKDVPRKPGRTRAPHPRWPPASPLDLRDRASGPQRACISDQETRRHL